MTREYILKKLQEHKLYLEEEFGVKKIGLFGSYATNSAQEGSDIDIFVDIQDAKFRKVARLWNYLESLYNTKIDLFQEHQKSSGAIYEHIKKETIFV